jgi:hypothetical protein
VTSTEAKLMPKSTSALAIPSGVLLRRQAHVPDIGKAFGAQ